MIAAAQHSAGGSKNPSAQQQLVQSCKVSWKEGQDPDLEAPSDSLAPTRAIWGCLHRPRLVGK